MGSPLISLVTDAATELGIPTPQYVINALDNTGRQMGALANRVGRMLVRMHDWSFLTALWQITVPEPLTQNATTTQGSTTVSGFTSPFVGALLPNQMLVTGQGLMTSTRLVATNLALGTVTLDQPATASGGVAVTFQQDAFPIPSDWERAIDRTAWDRSQRWEMRGPQTPQWDQWVRSGIVATGPRRQYRQIDNMWRIWPAPSSNYQGGQLISEYVSNAWVTSAAGAGQPRFLNDQDTCAFPDDIMVFGLSSMFLRIKGFSYDAYERTFLLAVQNAIATDGPAATLDMSRRNWPTFISSANVADSGFGGASPFGNP